jgi:hypothetical protein
MAGTTPRPKQRQLGGSCDKRNSSRPLCLEMPARSALAGHRLNVAARR